MGTLAFTIEGGSVNLDYRGYGPAWWGSDMALLRHGDGHFLVTTMPRYEQLGQDPLADRVVANMVLWVAGLRGKLAPARDDPGILFRTQFEEFRKKNNEGR